MRYLRRRYYSDDHGWTPQPGTTFSEVHGTWCPPCTEWLEPEDREASKADMVEIETAARKMKRELLIKLLRELGVCVHDRERKSDLVRRVLLIEMRRRWPIMVVA